MRSKGRRATGEADLLRSRLDAIIGMGPPAGETGTDDRLVAPRAEVRRGI